MAAVAEGVLILLTSLAMAEGAVVLAAQEVKVLVLLGTVDYRPSKEPRRETGQAAEAQEVGQKAQASQVTLPNMVAEAEVLETPLALVTSQAEVRCTVAEVEAEPVGTTLPQKLAVPGVVMDMVAAEPVARQKL
tara:strand:- start:129 stop:530 length:402 start_codon:yes stop_codon:yes gene_type:complete